MIRDRAKLVSVEQIAAELHNSYAALFDADVAGPGHACTWTDHQTGEGTAFYDAAMVLYENTGIAPETVSAVLTAFLQAQEFAIARQV